MTTMTAERLIHGMELDKLFSLDNILADLREGVVTNKAKGRVCLLSTDLLLGVYNAILEEAGPAWGLLMKTCGQVWGTRLARKLVRESDIVLGKSYVDLPLQEYLLFVTEYFCFHGWGVLELDVSKAQSRGLVEASLSHSIFAEVIKEKEENEMVDHMISGILSSLFSFVSDQELDCIQTQCASLGHEQSRFVITSAERVDKALDLVESGSTHQQVVDQI